MSKSKSKEPSVQAVVNFSSVEAKDLFLSVLSEYSDGVEKLMDTLAPTRGYGNGDSKVNVMGDSINVTLRDKDKGLVLTSDGFLQHVDIKEGKRYMILKEGKPAIFVKGSNDNADVLLGLASDVPLLAIELSREGGVASVIEAAS